MNVKAGVNFHNRFDIEVRDVKTGELKQKGQAENIVLDRMYGILCNFNSYFRNIHFGQGTGTLDPSRNTLFDKLGYKSATTEETIKAFPVSKWTRKITLNPEEYVGKSITEVGISDSSIYINTHALIKDAEGNPLSIEKTDTDVVIIYATVFIELKNRSENIYFTHLPNNNDLLNYLLGDSGPSSYIRLGKKWTKGDMLDGNIISSKSANLSSNLSNKKVSLNTRFGITEGNGNIAEMEAFNSFNITLPEINVFKRYELKDIQLGVGNGVNKRFVIPNIRAENIVVKVDNVVNNDIVMQNCNNVNFKVQDLIGVGSDGRGVTISSDVNIIVTASYSSSPYFTVHRLNADTGEYEKVQDLTGVGSGGNRVTISPDGNIIVAVSYNSPYFTVHRLNADTGEYEKGQDLTGVGNRGQGVSISPDGNIIVTASFSSSPYFTVHRLNADTGEYEKGQDLTGVGNRGQGVSISPDGNIIVTASYNSPYFTVHRLNADTGEYEKGQDLTGVGSGGNRVTISPDGNMIVTASESSPYFTIHNFEKKFKTIIFTTPPPEGAVITADYIVPYIPKTEDYVLDVTAEIQFGEGI